MNTTIILAVSIGGYSLFLALYFLLSSIDQKQSGKKYDFLTDFMFEFGSISRKPGIAAKTCLSLAYASATLGCLLLAFVPGSGSLFGLSVFMAVFAFLSAAAIVSVSIVPAYMFRSHLISTVVFFVAQIMVDVTASIILLNVYSTIHEPVSLLILAIVFVVLAVAKASILLNPKLSRWTELSAYMDETGAITTKRPRPFPLAFSQWLCLFLSIATSVLVPVSLYLVSIAL